MVMVALMFMYFTEPCIMECYLLLSLRAVLYQFFPHRFMGHKFKGEKEDHSVNYSMAKKTRSARYLLSLYCVSDRFGNNLYSCGTAQISDIPQKRNESM